MDKIVVAVGTTALAVGLVFMGIVLGTMGGAVSAWIVGLFFGDTILGIAGQLGLHGSMWQLGAFLGFVAGFFRSTYSSKSK